MKNFSKNSIFIDFHQTLKIGHFSLKIDFLIFKILFIFGQEIFYLKCYHAIIYINLIYVLYYFLAHINEHEL